MPVLEIYKTSLTDESFNYFYLTSSYSKVQGYMTILKWRDSLWDQIMLKSKVTTISSNRVHLLASRITTVFNLKVEAGRCTISVSNKPWDESKFLLNHWSLQWNGWNTNTHSPLTAFLGGRRVINSNNKLNILNSRRS